MRCCALVLALVLVLMLSSVRAFAEPAETSASGGELRATVALRAFRFLGPTATFWTRGYNGAIPGPTLRAQPGDVVRLTVENALQPHLLNNRVSFSSMHSPNTTALAFDSLRFRSSWDSGEIAAGAARTLEGVLDDTHPPGTHLYYSHFWGSSALQVGGGAAGVFVVEDTRNAVSDTIQNLPESVVLLQRFPFASPGLLEWAQELRDNVLGTATLPPQDVTLVNGQFRPVLTLQANQWHRLRVVWAAVEDSATLTLEGCEIEVLAKDGVYLEYSRPVPSIDVVPRSRVDVAVGCSQQGSFFLVASAATRQSNNKQDDMGMNTAASPTVSPSPSFGGSTEQFVLEIDVQQGSSSLQPATIGATLAGTSGFFGDLLGDENPDTHTVVFSRTAGGCVVNGLPYTGKAALSINPNRTQEWTLVGVDQFPVTFLTRHVQLAEVESAGGLHVTGDWVTTLGGTGVGSTARVRFRTDESVVFQAANLAFADRGCRGWADSSNDGATNADPGHDENGFEISSFKGIATVVGSGLAVVLVIGAMARRRALSIHRSLEPKAKRKPPPLPVAVQPPAALPLPSAPPLPSQAPGDTEPHARPKKDKPPTLRPKKKPRQWAPRVVASRMGRRRQRALVSGARGGSSYANSSDPRHQRRAFSWEDAF